MTSPADLARNSSDPTILLERIAQLEAELQQLRAQREEAARDLEVFARCVSHDLRTPLMAIGGFGDLLTEHLGAQLDPTAQRYLTRIRESTERLTRLLQEVVTLVRTGRQALNVEALDLSALATQVSHQLLMAEPQRKVSIQIASELRTRGDAALVTRLLEKLLANAWKFTGRHPTPQIEVGQRHEQAETVFYVRDNGVGYDMRYAERLFQPFQRLHAEKDFPGVGTGLATAAQIVRRHGGRIWAEASPDQGATFYFTLSAA